MYMHNTCSTDTKQYTVHVHVHTVCDCTQKLHVELKTCCFPSHLFGMVVSVGKPPGGISPMGESVCPHDARGPAGARLGPGVLACTRFD